MRISLRTTFLVDMFLVFLLTQIMTETSLICRQQQNDSNTFTVTVSQDCLDYSWKVNLRPVANAEKNSPLVLNHGPRNITFKSCQANVSYFCDVPTRQDVSCSQNECLEHQELNATVDNPSKQNDSSVSSSIIIIIVVIVISGIVGIIWFVRWRRRQRLRENEQDDYDPVKQEDPNETKV